jgi:enterochelin esterase family protein
MGKTNHYFYMPQGKPTEWMIQSRGSLRGELTQTVLSGGGLVAGGKRIVHFYQPPGDEPAPLLVVWDGGDYLRRAKLVTVVENMISAGRIRPLALAMPENGGPARFMEYACSEATLGFLHWAVLPEARRRLNLLDYAEIPGAYGVLGASMGGLMALYTGLRLPHIFGHVLAQSGGYVVDGFEFVTGALVEHGPQRDLRIWMDVGQFEGLREANQNMCALLTARGYAPDYHEYPAGHNYPAWRDDLPGGLEAMFGCENS